MSLEKDDIVEVKEKDDNGWWLVIKSGVEGWAPNNYLELVPPKAAPAAPPPPPRRPAAPAAPTPKPAASSVTANATAKPVAVFPGMGGGSNGSATPWKKPASTPSPQPSGGASKAPPPVVAAKPKPPPVAAKPGAPKVGGKPPVPGAPRPTATGGAPKPSAAPRPAGAVGQLDLSAAVRFTFQY